MIKTLILSCLAFLSILTGFTSCSNPVQTDKLSYSVPYVKFESSEIQFFKEWKGEDDPIVLYADQLGKSPEKSDLSATLNFSWSSEGLIINARLEDDVCITDTTNPAKSDGIEIYISPFRGSTDIVQLVIIPGDTQSSAKIITRDFRTSSKIRGIQVNSNAFSKRTEGACYLKVLIPLEGFGLKPELNTSLALQINVNDVDQVNGTLENQLQWYSVSFGNASSFAMNDLILADKKEIFPKETSKCYILDNDKLNIIVYSNTLKNNEIRIVNQNTTLFSSDTVRFFPFSIQFSADKFNGDKDTIKIFLNDRLISAHDLFICPRIYKNIKPPGTFERDIRFFEAQDRIIPIPDSATLFIGSSSIKRWFSLQDYFPDMNILHRGFGGSTAFEALMYIDRIVLPYKPSKIIYYEGDNDIARGYSQEKIIADIDSFITIVHRNIPDTKIYILSPKPSYARIKLLNKYTELHSALIKLCSNYQFVSYIDVSTPLYDQHGKLRRDIFVSDSLHLNEAGYKIWGQVIRNELNLE